MFLSDEMSFALLDFFSTNICLRISCPSLVWTEYATLTLGQTPTIPIQAEESW
jgi:hypothetical protein